MPLHDLVDLQLRVPDPDALVRFWTGRGLVDRGDGVLGTDERPSQLRVAHGSFRHVADLRLACDTERDLRDIASRLTSLGIAAILTDGRLQVDDPLLDHTVTIDVVARGSREVGALTAPRERVMNRPGATDRVDRRSTACLGDAPHRPRRVGHVVFGTPDVEASRAFYVDGLGFKVSDAVGGGIAYFLRCSQDHHNLLLSPAPVPCLNHYAVEMDDVDAIGLAAGEILDERPDCAVAGLGRHIVGANLFWYLLDPAGAMFELFADMDQIVDDERWAAEVRRDDWDPFGVSAWTANQPSPDFWLPSDIEELASARQRVGR
jgi:catechol 2,3-dioxygenase-like lactoylglutathione lyase family enzyme